MAHLTAGNLVRVQDPSYAKIILERDLDVTKTYEVERSGLCPGRTCCDNANHRLVTLKDVPGIFDAEYFEQV